MAKQSAPIQEVSRLLDLVPFLSTHSHISLKELAHEFGVSEKEMGNELMALSMCGLPGYTPYELIEVFFDSGFVTINNHDTLDIPRALSHLEVASLLIGLEILHDSLDASETASIEKVADLIQQLTSLIGATITVEENASSIHISSIRRAIARRASLEIEYLSPVRDEVTVRVIDPLSLSSDREFTYLEALCRTSSGVRNFRLDRISALREMGAGEVPPLSAVNSHSERLTARLGISGSRRSVGELFGVDIAPHDSELEVETFSEQWLLKAVAAYAPELAILQPEDIRQRCTIELENILALYTP